MHQLILPPRTLRRPRPLRFQLLAPLLLALAACAIPISYYDSTTYTNLTSLKAELTSLVESFDKLKVEKNEARIESALLSLRKAHEYEKGKGDPNSDTARQFELISGLFAEDVEEYRKHGPNHAENGPKYFQEAAVALAQAFDSAIATENLKNKDKR